MPVKKQHRSLGAVLFWTLLALCAHLSEALAAENGTVGLGLEGNLGLAAAACAGSGEELTGATGGVLASITAVLATLGLVLEATLSVESLLTSGEHELIAALFANQILIFVHCFYLSSVSCPVNATGNIVGTRSLLIFCGRTTVELYHINKICQ